MSIHKRRSTRPLDDLPGILDDYDPQLHSSAYSSIIEEHRKKQRSTSGLSIDFSAGEVMPHRQLQFMSFGSGSSGNCAYLGIVGEGGILIDGGVDPDTVMAALHANAIPTDKIVGMLLTHDHLDHVKYAYPLARKLRNCKIYCTLRSLNAILRKHNVSRRIKDLHVSVFKEHETEIGPFMVTPFEVSHDAHDNAGYSIVGGSMHFVATGDLGTITPRADYYLRQANIMMIQANYDAAMLESHECPYPEYVKARIRSDIGHMDNTVTAAYLSKIWTHQLTDIYLCHISPYSNTPELALSVISNALKSRGVTVGDSSGSFKAREALVRISALPRTDPSPLFIHRIQ